MISLICDLYKKLYYSLLYICLFVCSSDRLLPGLQVSLSNSLLLNTISKASAKWLNIIYNKYILKWIYSRWYPAGGSKTRCRHLRQSVALSSERRLEDGPRELSAQYARTQGNCQPFHQLEDPSVMIDLPAALLLQSTRRQYNTTATVH